MPTRARVSLGYTVNTGNFESLRVDISVEDSARQGEKAAELTQRVYTFVETELLNRVNEIKKELKSGE